MNPLSNILRRSAASLLGSLLLSLCLFASAALAEPGQPGSMPIAEATIAFGSGPTAIVLHIDDKGLLSLTADGNTKEIGTLDTSGKLSTAPEVPGLELDAEGYVIGDGEETPVRIDPQGVVYFTDKTVFKVENGAVVPLDTFADVGEQLKEVKITGGSGSERLLSFLIVAYLLMV